MKDLKSLLYSRVKFILMGTNQNDYDLNFIPNLDYCHGVLGFWGFGVLGQGFRV